MGRIASGHLRHFERAPVTSGLHPTSEVSLRCGEPTVCISHTVYEQVRNKLDLDYHPLGSHRVKNIAEPVRVYAVGFSAVPGRARKRPRLLLAAAGASGLVVAGLAMWALYTGAGRDLLGLGAAAPTPVEVAGLAAPHEVTALAQRHAFSLRETVPMPANNLSVIFERGP